MKTVRALSIAFSLQLLAGSAAAEVRLRPAHAGGGTMVTVTESEAGPWSPNGRVDFRTLNPLGDMLLDGRPVHAQGSDAALVAWRSGTDGRVRLALGRESWRELSTLGVTRHGSTPRVALVRDGWVVAWEPSMASAPTTELVFVSFAGDVQAGDASLPGAAVAVGAVGDTLHVLVLDPASGALDDVVIAIGVPNPTPWPIDVLARVRLGDTTQRFAAPPRNVSAGQRSADASPAAAIVATKADDAVVLVAVWWLNPHALQFARLLDGDIAPVRSVTGRSEYSAALLKEALRLAAED